MVDNDAIEIGTREFNKGLDRLNIAKTYFDSINKSKAILTDNDQRKLTKDTENTADFLTRSIDIILKSLAYLYIPDVDPSILIGHRQTPVIDLLLDSYDIAPELKEINETLTDIRLVAYRIHNFIKLSAYEGCNIYTRNLTTFFDYANILKDFGIRHGLNDFDKFVELHTLKNEEETKDENK